MGQNRNQGFDRTNTQGQGQGQGQGRNAGSTHTDQGGDARHMDDSGWSRGEGHYRTDDSHGGGQGSGYREDRDFAGSRQAQQGWSSQGGQQGSMGGQSWRGTGNYGVQGGGQNGYEGGGNYSRQDNSTQRYGQQQNQGYGQQHNPGYGGQGYQTPGTQSYGSEGGWQGSQRGSFGGDRNMSERSFGGGMTMGDDFNRNHGARPGWQNQNQGQSYGQNQGQNQDNKFGTLGPKGYKRSDERIQEEVCDALSEGHIDAREIEVSVANGEVTLKGTVTQRQDKQRAEQLAESIRGVGDVNNELRMKRVDGKTEQPQGKKDDLGAATTPQNGVRGERSTRSS